MGAPPSPAIDAETLLSAVREFVERAVRPAVAELEHADRYPHALVTRLAELGLFGALVPRAWGGLGLDVTTYARVIEELCRGWMSLAGVLNSHTMAALIILHHGTDAQRDRFLPRFARGQARGGLCLTEPQAGSDVQAIRTVARRQGEGYLLSGTKMFVTNGREGDTFALLALTDPRAEPRHRGMSCFIVEKGHPGFRVVKSIAKLGYKGVDTAELLLEDVEVPAANLVGGVEGRGFKQVLGGLEAGRINIAARAVGVAQAACDEARAALRSRAATGGGAAAEATLETMAARLQAARLLTYWAAGMKDRGERCDLEAGMAKLLASETAQVLAGEALRLAGPAGHVVPSTVERLYRDTPLMIIGEGTNEIQRLVIARQLLERHGERLGALTSREGEPEERRQLVLAVRQVVDKDIAPVATELEHAGRWPGGLLGRLADLGLLGAVVPQADGGLDLDALTTAMIVEELARGWAALASIVTGHLAAALAVAGFADGPPREALLPPLTRGEMLGASGLAPGLVARRQDGGWAVHGETGPVTAAAHAGLLLLRVAAGDDAEAALVMRPGAAGLTLGMPVETVGGRGLDPATVRLDARLPADAWLGASVARGREALQAAAALARLGTAATAVGLAQAAFEAALRYSQQRSAFGRPICHHQAIQLKLADMATRITAARLLAYHAAEGLRAEPEAAGRARAYATDVAAEVTLESMRIHGGYGYTAEFPVERYYREAARLAAEP